MVFKFLKKKKKEDLPLPPPPSPPHVKQVLQGDIEPIRPRQQQERQSAPPPMPPPPEQHRYGQAPPAQEYDDFPAPQEQPPLPPAPEYDQQPPAYSSEQSQAPLQPLPAQPDSEQSWEPQPHPSQRQTPHAPQYEQQWQPPVEQIRAPDVPEKVVYDRTIQQKREEKPEPVRAPIKPAFVAVDDYHKIINDTNTVRAKLLEAEQFVKRLTDIKNEEERAFDKWRGQLEDVEKKLSYVDELIAQAQR